MKQKRYLIILLQELNDVSGQCCRGTQEDVYRLKHHHGGAGNTEQAGEWVHHRDHGPPTNHKYCHMYNHTIHNKPDFFSTFGKY